MVKVSTNLSALRVLTVLPSVFSVVDLIESRTKHVLFNLKTSILDIQNKHKVGKGRASQIYVGGGTLPAIIKQKNAFSTRFIFKIDGKYEEKIYALDIGEVFAP